MLEQLKHEANYTCTENGALTYASTTNFCLDLFATIGALRGAMAWDITTRFLRAYAENADLAMKCLFFARDIRQGLGERNTFKVILKWLACHHPNSVVKNISLIPEYGRYDDLLVLLETPCQEAAVELIARQLEADLAALEQGEAISLLGKWLPSINASKGETIHQAKVLAQALKLDNKTYRQTTSKLRKALALLENSLRVRDYSFDYAKQPSKAMLKYRQAFLRNDRARYVNFLDSVAQGEAQLHTGTLTPYDIVGKILDKGYLPIDETETLALDTTWKALEDFTYGENALVVADGSGSMYCGRSGNLPAAVAQSLAIYFAEHNQGLFHNHFITFSQRPQLIEILGGDIVEKVSYCASFDEIANTDLQAVFDLLLATALKHNLPQEELPNRLYIISDMEFDECVKSSDLTNFELAKEKFQAAGYQLPQVVFWNVDSRNTQQPVKANEQGVALVSGCTPQLFSMLKTKELEPLTFMLQTLNGPRYASIVA